MTVSRVAACALLAAMLGAAPEPAATPPADHVFALAGTWTCRSLFGAQTREVGTVRGNVLDVLNEVRAADGQSSTLYDRYAFDDAAKIWRVEFGDGSAPAVTAVGAPWTGPVWELVGRDAQGVVQRIRFELLPGGDVRRTFLRELPAARGSWVPASAQRCSPGDVPPPVDACIAENLPAYTVAAVAPSMRDVPPQTPLGTVRVVVGLDAQSHVVSATIQSSPSAYLNRLALNAARDSQFQTEIRGCRPIAAAFVFSVTFGP